MSRFVESVVNRIPRLNLFRLSITIFAVSCLASAAFAQDYEELWKEGKYSEALDVLQKEIDERPELRQIRAFRYVRWLSHRAQLYFEVGKLDEAIADLEYICEYVPEPGFTLRLAELYRYKGMSEEYHQTLLTAAQQTGRRWYFLDQEENILAVGKISGLLGENPKVLLSSYYSPLMTNYPRFANGFIGAAELALSKADYPLAQKYFEQALEIDPENQDALAGLAQCYWLSGEPKVDDVLEKLLEINPNHHRGNAVQVEMLLEANEVETAMEVIEDTLEINPNHLQTRALKAAAFFLQDKPDELKKEQEAVLAYNPLCSEVYRVPGRIASRKYRFKEAAEFQHKALETDPEDHEARALYALDLLRLGREQEGEEQLAKAYEADKFNVQVYNMLSLMDTLDRFETIQRGPFMLKLPKSESSALAEDALTLLQQAYDLYRIKYKVEITPPIHVQIFDNHDDFIVRSLGLPGQIGFMGICFGNLVTMDSPSARPKHEMNWRAVLWHEFVHVITLNKTNNRMPRWLSEGISVYEELALSPACGHKMDFSYKAFIDFDDLPVVEDLEKFFTQPKSPMDIQIGYFLAGEFITFYTQQYGFSPLPDALAMIGEGMDTEEALSKASGDDLDDMDEKFQDYLEKRLQPYENLPEIKTEEEPSPIAQRQASQSSWMQEPSLYTNAIQAAVLAMEEQDWERAEAKLLQAHDFFPDYTGANAPLRGLLSLYEQWNKPEKRIETLWKILDWDSTGYDESQILITTMKNLGEWEKTIKAAEWACGIDPFDVQTRKVMLEGYTHLQQYDKAVTTADQLVRLDPSHAIDYRVQKIDLLVKDQKIEQAKRDTVILLEEYPNFWDAQQRLLSIVEKIN